LEDFVLDKHLRFFGSEFPTAGFTVKTDFAVKMYLSTAALGTYYILISRIKHFLSDLPLILKYLLIALNILSAISGQMLNYKVTLFNLSA
jgi:hypothetical protein